MGMADYYEGPIENPDWLELSDTNPRKLHTSERLISKVMEGDVSYAEEWEIDHGIMVHYHP